MRRLINAIRRLRKAPALCKRLLRLPAELDEAKLLIAKQLILHMKGRGIEASIQESEFKVFSQFGDDGIVQYLIHHLEIPPDLRTFIEFGVENYAESNTRFLLMNDNWRGLVIDGDPGNMAQLRAADYYWKHDLTATAAFIDRDNVNDLFRNHGFSGEIGLLSIDIDGNDYWVWERIEAVNPIVVVVEYNAVYGPSRAVTIPYDPAFRRGRAHFSNLYWGCSLKALHLLARKKGYAFVGCNSAGNNAYFVRHDKLGALEALSVEEGFSPSRFRESRNPGGHLNWLHEQERLAAIQDMIVYDLETGRNINVAEILDTKGAHESKI